MPIKKIKDKVKLFIRNFKTGEITKNGDKEVKDIEINMDKLPKSYQLNEDELREIFNENANPVSFSMDIVPNEYNERLRFKRKGWRDINKLRKGAK